MISLPKGRAWSRSAAALASLAALAGCSAATGAAGGGHAASGGATTAISFNSARCGGHWQARPGLHTFVLKNDASARWTRSAP